MMTNREIELLQHIRTAYGAVIAEAAARYRHREEVMAGICMRETEGGLSKLLDKPGPEGRGDCEVKTLPDGSKVKVYHGHGLFQIDDRSFPKFCASEKWKDPLENALAAAECLAGKRQTIARLAPKKGLEVPDLERAAIAGYNCGEGNVLKVLAEMKADPLACGPDYIDHNTTGRDYSRDVLRYARMYKELADA